MIKNLNIITYPNGEKSISNFEEIVQKTKLTGILEWFPDKDYALELIFLSRIAHTLSFQKLTIITTYLPWEREDKTINGRVNMEETYRILFGHNVTFKTPILHPLKWNSRHFVNDYQTLLSHPLFWQNLDFVKTTDQFNVVLVFPDQSSYERNKLLLLNQGWNIIVCDKHRNGADGKIEKMYLDSEKTTFSIGFNQKPEDFKFLIIDDICVKGGTFVGALEVIKEIYPEFDFTEKNTMLWTWFDENNPNKKWSLPHTFVETVDFN